MRKTKSLGRADIAATIRLELGLSHPASREFVDQILSHMCNAFSTGEPVKLVGFGNFEIHTSAPRMGRNVQTKAPLPIEPRRVLRFRPSALRRERLNLG
jgi:integration host factor subunit alpha